MGAGTQRSPCEPARRKAARWRRFAGADPRPPFHVRRSVNAREGTCHAARDKLSIVERPGPGDGLGLRPRLRAGGRGAADPRLRRAFPPLLPYDRGAHGRRLHRGRRRPRGPRRNRHRERHLGRLGRRGTAHHDGGREAVQGPRVREVPRPALLPVRPLHGLDDRARLQREVRRRAGRRRLLRHHRHLQEHARGAREAGRGHRRRHSWAS